MVLDRQVAFALGWLALAQLVVQPDRARPLVAVAIGVATLVHPSAGLQLALVLSGSVTAWWLLRRWTEVSWRSALSWLAVLALAVIPGLAINLGPGPGLMGGMSASDFWLLSVELQSPQHMLPHLWRMPQWLACFSYLTLAALAVGALEIGRRAGSDRMEVHAPVDFSWPRARVRLVAVLGVIMGGLALSWFLIEKRHAVQVTVFQPFRMATIARGIALVLIAGRVVSLWGAAGWLPRMRAILLAVAVSGDWLMVVVTVAELAVSTVEAVRIRLSARSALAGRRCRRLSGDALLGVELSWASRHGIRPLAASRCDRRERRRVASRRFAIARTCDQILDLDGCSPAGRPCALVGCTGRGVSRLARPARSSFGSLWSGARIDQPLSVRRGTG